TFVLIPNSGNDTIVDYRKAGTDRLDVSAFGFASFAQMHTQISAVDHDADSDSAIDDVTLDLGFGVSLTLLDNLFAYFDADDFLF
ncbi:MAG: hypothetical protein KDA91_13570, partial [Planctomycetaceae bacterium]|nr:hypothetical protein [Planctomycetaceae bacterium]